MIMFLEILLVTPAILLVTSVTNLIYTHAIIMFNALLHFFSNSKYVYLS